MTRNSNTDESDGTDRRTFLSTFSAVSLAAVAGCASSDDSDDYQSGSDDDGSSDDGSADDGDDDGSGDDSENGDDDEPDLPDEEEVEQRDEGEDYLEFGDLVIQDHELIVDEGDFMDDVSVEGVVENVGDEMFDYVEVGVRVYDSDGHQLDRYMTNTQDLSADSTWRFDIMIMEDADDVDDYDIGVSGSIYGW